MEEMWSSGWQSSLELNWELCVLLIKTVWQILSSVCDVPASVVATVLTIILCLLYMPHLQVPRNLSMQWKIGFLNLHVFFFFFQTAKATGLLVFHIELNQKSLEYLNEAGPETQESLLGCATLWVSPASLRLSRLRKLVQTCFVERLPNLLSD